MPGIPVRRDPHEGSKYPSKIVGERAKQVRDLRDWSQEYVSDQMFALGHESWKRQTVGQVESGARNLTVDELVSLASALNTNVAFLMSPVSPWDQETEPLVDIGGPEALGLSDLQEVYGFPLARTLAGREPFTPAVNFPTGEVRQGPPPSISYPSRHEDNQGGENS